MLEITELDRPRPVRPPCAQALVPNGPTPLYQQLSDLLREQIRRGTYGPLDRLPSEHELARRYAISRITVRQALADLERTGLVFRRQGRGSFVALPTVVQRLTHLTGFGAAMAAQGFQSISRLLRAGTVRAPARVAERLGVVAGAPVFEIRRLRLVDGAAASYDLSYFPADLGRRLAREDLVGRDIFWLLEHAYGVRLGTADHEIAAVPAAGEVALELGVPRGTPLLLVDRLTHDRAGTPIEYEHLYVRSDRVRYAVRLEPEGPHPEAKCR